MEAKKERLLLICERDVGLFSLIQQVIANVPRAIVEGRIPVAFLRNDCSYFTPNGYRGRDTVWEYYFEPLVADFPAAKVPGRIAAQISAWPPEADTVGYRVDEYCFATSHFGDHPELHDASLHIPWEWDDPSDDLRKKAAPIIKEYIRPRSYLTERADRFYKECLAGQQVIGVQIRGTDATSSQEERAFRVGSLRPKRYFEEVEKILRQSSHVKHAAVLAKPEANGSKQLVGYIVPEGGFDVTAIRKFMKSHLPGYMVPAVFMPLEQFPLNAKPTKSKPTMSLSTSAHPVSTKNDTTVRSPFGPGSVA